jgi:hypothetical protein
MIAADQHERPISNSPSSIGGSSTFFDRGSLSLRLVVCGPAQLARFPGSVLGAWFAGPHSPWSQNFAPPAPQLIARPRSRAS